ncbi:hypothetical protein [Kibdelosporangium philippinense]|uniref:hypothetical protein n=1 Tax=Kibdelosporangium philippinense TaxID=211113 RepID=UPI00362351B2
MSGQNRTYSGGPDPRGTPSRRRRHSTWTIHREHIDERCATAGAVRDPARNPDGGALQHEPMDDFYHALAAVKPRRRPDEPPAAPDRR